jgi:uncharacterized membrane protein YkvA (DUF1232 family)
VVAVQKALFDDGTPPAARRVLVGALNYVLDTLDMFPDHYKGLGVADDAIVLRIGAAQAVASGADDEMLRRLGREADEVRALFPDLAEPLAQFVAALPGRAVRGRTVDQILSQKDVRVVFEADLGREMSRHAPSPIDTETLGAAATVKELEKMIRSALAKAGLLKK